MWLIKQPLCGIKKVADRGVEEQTDDQRMSLSRVFVEVTPPGSTTKASETRTRTHTPRMK